MADPDLQIRGRRVGGLKNFFFGPSGLILVYLGWGGGGGGVRSSPESATGKLHFWLVG